MSREIKVRAWVKPLKRYANGIDTILYQACDVEGGDVWSVVCEEWDSEVYECDDIVIEQYTGLKDENGKEIYEGDIVRYADDYEENAEVVFDDGGFQVEWPINIERLEGDITCMMEVIGNIHENPELLGDEG